MSIVIYQYKCNISVLFCSLKPLEEDVTDLQSHVLGSVFLQCSSIFFHIGKEIVVYVRGEGLNDKGKTGKRGRAVIKVNGKDYSPHRTGFNIVVLNAVTGILFFLCFCKGGIIYQCNVYV